uniref:Uncharacterized protein n=1 Tax=Timema cristinae TaxID=61476 RepID=A0A7R9DHR7_TIMCR|nr:unnamed protein product [Timema cristinae]
METVDLITTKNVTSAITNRKEFGKDKVQWLKISCLKVTQDKPYIMKCKYSYNDCVLYQSINFSKSLPKASNNSSKENVRPKSSKKSLNTEDKPQFPLYQLPLCVKYPCGKSLTTAKKGGPAVDALERKTLDLQPSKRRSQIDSEHGAHPRPMVLQDKSLGFSQQLLQDQEAYSKQFLYQMIYYQCKQT